MEDFLAEHKVGDLVTGRILGVEGSDARIELGEGIVARCNLQTTPAPEKSSPVAGEIDLSSLTSMLNARWKTGGSGAATEQAPTRTGADPQLHDHELASRIGEHRAQAGRLGDRVSTDQER